MPTGLITAGVLTRRLGPEGYGLFTLASVLVAWLEWTLTSLFERTTIKFAREVEDWPSFCTAIAQLHLGLGCLMGLLLAALAAPLGAAFHEPSLAGYLQLYALDIPIFCLAYAQRQLLIGRGEFRERAIASASRWTARFLLITLLLLNGFSIYGAIWGTIGASLIELGVGRQFIQPAIFARSTFPIRKLFDYAVPLFLFAAILRCYDKLDLIMLKLLDGSAAQMGIYSAAQNLAFVPSLFAMSFSPLLLSVLSQTLREENWPKAQHIERNALRLTVILLPFVALAAGSANAIVGLVYGAEFLPAATLLALLLLGALALVSISIATAILTAIGRPKLTLWAVSPLLPVSLVGYGLVIPHWGSVGAALVSVATATLGAALSLGLVYHQCRVLPPLGTGLRALGISAVLYAVASQWIAPDSMFIFKFCLLGGMTPLGFLLLGECDRRELQSLRAWILSTLGRINQRSS
ncbi:MAG: oligosaccharide flippase family protein [Synechococcales cyanobacterium RU_4_20]|nr:oligosaccharide flippase family protein [Synechococcales cyanobacterium RU_4_20]NJR70571.1 oligosaccharide flippase family protein [Synechococcales cyanobacterium CRU_2_2]